MLYKIHFPYQFKGAFDYLIPISVLWFFLHFVYLINTTSMKKVKNIPISLYSILLIYGSYINIGSHPMQHAFKSNYDSVIRFLCPPYPQFYSYLFLILAMLSGVNPKLASVPQENHWSTFGFINHLKNVTDKFTLRLMI